MRYPMRMSCGDEDPKPTTAIHICIVSWLMYIFFKVKCKSFFILNYSPIYLHMWRRKEWEEKVITYSKHHILPKSHNGATNDTNIEIIRDTTHRAIHTLFENKMIAEQLIKTVNLSEKALRDDVRRWLIETLTSRNIYDPYLWYKWSAIE